jgi:hypothetical protein
MLDFSDDFFAALMTRPEQSNHEPTNSDHDLISHSSMIAARTLRVRREGKPASLSDFMLQSPPASKSGWLKAM